VNPTKLQSEVANKLTNNNTSLKWNGIYGFYSNGDVVINVYWNFDKETTYNITIKSNGMYY
jgi:hypothetical protein